MLGLLFWYPGQVRWMLPASSVPWTRPYSTIRGSENARSMLQPSQLWHSQSRQCVFPWQCFYLLYNFDRDAFEGFWACRRTMFIHQPCYPDSDSGPEVVWRWAHYSQRTDDVVCSLDQKHWRHWMYVMWDRIRLNDLGILQSLWEVNDECKCVRWWKMAASSRHMWSVKNGHIYWLEMGGFKDQNNTTFTFIQSTVSSSPCHRHLTHPLTDSKK